MGCFETGMVIGLATVTSHNCYRLTIWTWPWSKYLERPTHTPTTRKYRNRGPSLGETFLWFHCYLLHISCDRCIGIYDWTQFGLHDAVIKWKHFPCYWPFVRESHRSPVNSPSQRPVTDEFPSQGRVARSFDGFFDLHLNKRLSKPSRLRWFETPSPPLWRYYNWFRGFQQIMGPLMFDHLIDQGPWQTTPYFIGINSSLL